MLKAIQLTPKNYLITYYLQVIWLFRQKKLNKRQMFWKNFKNLQVLLENFQNSRS